MVLNPKTPQHIRDAIARNENPMNSPYGWEMDKKICTFKPKYKVGSEVICLIISNEPHDDSYINEKTKVDYIRGEITGYYNVGYGVTVKKVIFQQNSLYKFYEKGGHHTLHFGWVEEKPYNKKLQEQLTNMRHKRRVFIFR